MLIQRGNLNVSFVLTLLATRTLAASPDIERDALFDTEAATGSPSAFRPDPFASIIPIALAQTSESSPAPPPVRSNPSVPAAGGLAEIVVTAQKRGENLQDVPISVVAFSADALTAAAVRTTADLNIVTPGLVSFETAGYAQPHLRGIGTIANGPGVENPVAIYVDGVYYSAMSASTLALNNIEQIEVDRGPQGTLFGRNATGGLIQITTRDPKPDFQGVASIGYGSYQTVESSAYVTGGIIENLAADFAAYYDNQEQGFGANIFTGHDVNKRQDAAFRSKWLYTPSATTEVKVGFDYEQTKSSPAWPPAPGTTPLGGPPYTGPTQGLDGYIDPAASSKQGGVSVFVKQQLAFADFVSLTAYRRSALDVSFSGGLVTNPAYVLNIEPIDIHRQYTEELQLLSRPDSTIKWATGAFLYYSKSGYDPISVTGGLLAPLGYINNFSNQEAKSGAVFGQATAPIATATNLTFGLRYTVEHRSVDVWQVLGNPDGTLAAPTVYDSGHATYQKPTWRVSLDHRFADQLLGYVSYNRGFKSGGFNDDLVPTSSYAPETLDAYEIGTKIDVLDRRIRLDIAEFYYRYKNVQTEQFPAGFELIYNGAAAKLYGTDFELTFAATDRLTIRTGFEALHSAYTSFPDANFTTPAPGGGTNFSTFNAAGDRVAVAPNFTGDVAVDYEIPIAQGKVDLNVTYAYNAGWFAEPDNRLHQSSYGLLSASAWWHLRDQLTSVRFWGKNLTNSQYAVSLASQSNGDYIQYAPPRTYGATVERRF